MSDTLTPEEHALYQNTATLQRILRQSRTIAVVGCSPKPDRPSHYVAAYLQQAGYRIIPVNPHAPPEILGQRVYASLREIPEPVDLVDVFRPSADCLEVARDAVAIGAKALWLQVGIVNREAGQLARAAGLEVVMDRCTKIEHAALGRAAP